MEQKSSTLWAQREEPHLGHSLPAPNRVEFPACCILMRPEREQLLCWGGGGGAPFKIFFHILCMILSVLPALMDSEMLPPHYCRSNSASLDGQTGLLQKDGAGGCWAVRLVSELMTKTNFALIKCSAGWISTTTLINDKNNCNCNEILQL